MNERIKQLAEQAMVSISYRVCQNTFKEVEDPAGHFVRKEFSKEKFAELIVRECAGISAQHNRNYYKSHGQLIADKIKEYFGVE